MDLGGDFSARPYRSFESRVDHRSRDNYESTHNHYSSGYEPKTERFPREISPSRRAIFTPDRVVIAKVKDEQFKILPQWDWKVSSRLAFMTKFEAVIRSTDTAWLLLNIKERSPEPKLTSNRRLPAVDSKQYYLRFQPTICALPISPHDCL